MDERCQTDLAKCVHLKSVLARELIEEVVIPRVDLGDPPPVWLDRARTEIESASQRQAHQVRELAAFVKGVDAELAASLRHLADGLVAVVAGRGE